MHCPVNRKHAVQHMVCAQYSMYTPIWLCGLQKSGSAVSLSVCQQKKCDYCRKDI